MTTLESHFYFNFDTQGLANTSQPGASNKDKSINYNTPLSKEERKSMHKSFEHPGTSIKTLSKTG